jgi:hypothetical protein
MDQEDIKKFKNVVNYLISKGGNLTNIGKEAGLTWPTMDAIMKDKPQNFRASTMGLIQDFVKKHNSVPMGLSRKIPKMEFEEDIPKDPNFGVLEFFVRVRELLQNVPKGYKCKIEIEKV